MTDPTVEAVARAISQAEYTTITGKQMPSYDGAGTVLKAMATAAIEALKALGWNPPEKPDSVQWRMR